MTDREFRIGDAEANFYDEMNVTFFRGALRIECENPWAGSTETGFGASANCTINAEQARALAAFLLACADDMDAKP